MPVIRPNHLEDLANQIAGRDRLGEILRNLIWSWIPNRVLGMSFLAGDVNNFPGWDGWVRLSPGKDESAEHRSVWQISVERNTLSKIKRDFKKSLLADIPPGWSRTETVYVAVTPRKLKNIEKLKADLRSTKGNTWGDVQIVGAADLEQWIEKCPAVEAWLGEEFGIGNGRFGDSLAKRWLRWSGATAPAISSELMLAGRDTKSVEVGLRFEHDRIFAIQADSPEEAVALLYAVIDAQPEATRYRLLANALVVSSEAHAEAYALQPFGRDMAPLTILVPPAVSCTNRLERAGHHVVMAFGRNSTHSRSMLIKRALRSDFEKALSGSMKLPSADAAAQARACGSSVSIWRIWNLLQTASPGDQIPTWASNDTAASLVVPAALVRSWDDDCQGDKDIVAGLSSQKYADYRDSLQPFGTCDDPLYERVDSVFYLVAPAVAFTLIQRLITDSHLDALKNAVTTVFGEIEKEVTDVWNAPPDDNPRMKEKSRYSTWLRDGLAETLLSIAYLGGTSFSSRSGIVSGQDFVNRVVRALPGLASDPRMLASLRDQLPYLAEAAPLPFVEALESLLQGDSARLKPLFVDRGFFGSTFQSGLLWAMETLAWSTEYLARVSLILCHLESIGSGGNNGNRPINSLREIFLAWHPGTSASIENRVAVLRLLHEKHPEVAWMLLLKLLPHAHDSASPTQEPTWRDFGRSEMPVLTKHAVALAYRKYAELCLDLADGDLKKQITLIPEFPQFPAEYRKRILDMLNTMSSQFPPESLRVETRDALRKLVAHHRAFNDAQWAMKESDLQELEATAAKYLPVDPLNRHKWVLDDQWPQTGFKADDFEGNEREIARRREEAINDILNHLGWAGIHRAITESKCSPVVATALAETSVSDTELFAAFDVWSIETSPNQLWGIRAASRVRLRITGDDWTRRLIAHAQLAGWTEEVLANAFLDYPATMDTFRLIASLGGNVEKYYWEHNWIHVSGGDGETKRAVAENYIRFGRAADIFGAVGNSLAHLGGPLVLQIIEQIIVQLNENRLPQDRSMFSFYLGNAFKWLRNQSDVTDMEVARLEYPFLALLTGRGHKHDETLTLHRLLSEDAEFFVQVLCDLYKPATATREQPADARAKEKATAAWRLLESWELVPGVQGDGSVSKEILNDWVAEARQLALDKDRADLADQHIGKMLYHVPADPRTNDWPPAFVLELIEKLDTKHIGRGFALECVNSRGVTSRAPLDGGSLEREEEVVWRMRAKKLGSKWPRVRALFDSMADNWVSHAKWHDDDAQKMRMRWS